ncbi:hypothetical protein ACOSP7_017276 [Xanthoceras sorbifolium]
MVLVSGSGFGVCEEEGELWLEAVYETRLVCVCRATRLLGGDTCESRGCFGNSEENWRAVSVCKREGNCK